jgi:hypothetical protein
VTLGSHQKTIGASQTYLTPPYIIEELGPFDTDPCAATGQPWPTADRHWTEEDDGLEKPWYGLVWCNPPFERYGVDKWVRRMAGHRSGILLVHARTETEWFKPIWARASGLLFLAHRLHFHKIDGGRHEANSGAPVVLASFGEEAARRLRRSRLSGYFVPGEAVQCKS